MLHTKLLRMSTKHLHHSPMLKMYVVSLEHKTGYLPCLLFVVRCPYFGTVTSAMITNELECTWVLQLKEFYKLVYPLQPDMNKHNTIPSGHATYCNRIFGWLLTVWTRFVEWKSPSIRFSTWIIIKSKLIINLINWLTDSWYWLVVFFKPLFYAYYNYNLICKMKLNVNNIT